METQMERLSTGTTVLCANSECREELFKDDEGEYEKFCPDCGEITGFDGPKECPTCGATRRLDERGTLLKFCIECTNAFPTSANSQAMGKFHDPVGCP